MVSNQEVADVLYRIADILEMQDVAFKPQAYRRAAQSIETYSKDISDVAKKGELQEIPGVGAGIAEHITEMLSNRGTSLYLEKLKKACPIKVDEIFSVEGMGPKRAILLYKKLKVTDLKSLEKAGREGRIATLSGFGQKTQDKILAGIAFAKNAGDRLLIAKAQPIAESIISTLKSSGKISKITYAGSLRRRKSTIGDIDILVTTKSPAEVMKQFTTMSSVERIMSSGPTKSTVRLRGGIQADLRVLPPEQWGSALLYFTGSKNHNIALRKIAISKGLKLSEYGVFKGEKVLASATEEDVYRKLGLSYIEPELREDHGEIEASLHKKSPILVERKDLRGDLHVHSNWSDGSAGILEMAQAAQRAGLSYMALTDHTGVLKIAGGLEPKDFEKQAKLISSVQSKLKGFRILQGCEVNIMEDGTPDLAESTLKKLDIVVGSIHHGLSNPKEKATKRLVKAIENPHIDIIGHPTGRIIGRRSGYEIDLDVVIDACKAHDKALEVDSIPERTDLDESMIRPAIERSVKISISSDSHSTDNFRFLEYGIFNARRGWAQKKDVLNTLPVEKLLTWAKKHE